LFKKNEKVGRRHLLVAVYRPPRSSLRVSWLT
jgi:hypothetical protein